MAEEERKDGKKREAQADIDACLNCTLPVRMCRGFGDPRACQKQYVEEERAKERARAQAEHREVVQQKARESRLLRQIDGMSSVRYHMERTGKPSHEIIAEMGIPAGSFYPIAYTRNAVPVKRPRLSLRKAQTLADIFEVSIWDIVEKEEGD